MVESVRLHLLGQTYATRQSGDDEQHCRIQPRPLYLLAYLGLNWQRAHRREELQVLFWGDKSPDAASNNLRQALWHLRQALPPDTLLLSEDRVQWNSAAAPWADALAFETALDDGDLDTALSLYVGPLLPDCYDEWAQLERERLHLRYLATLESRAHQHYKARRWQAALDDGSTLLNADPLNEAAVRLVMACHWAMNQRESARRCYDGYRQRARRELQTDPLPETSTLYQRILRGEPHPDQVAAPPDATIASQTAHLSLLETLGAFRQGLEQATTWVAQADGSARAEALRWQGAFYLRLGRLAEARAALTDALSLTASPQQQVAILSILATTETALGDYASAETHFTQALRVSPLALAARARLLGALGGLYGRRGNSAEARRTLEEAVRLARELGDPAVMAMTSGNLGILLIGQRETEAAERALQEALTAARRADAHWLTAHVTGHLGVLDQDRGDWESAARNYHNARALTETIGDQRAHLLWTLNLGIVRYEQARYADALSLLNAGREQAIAQGSKSLEAGAHIFIGACLVAQGQPADGLASIERGLALAQAIRDQERILIGLLHRGRALAAMNRTDEARATLQDGLRQAEASQMHRLGDYLRAELARVTNRPTSNL
jgi:DNA-binding SARP family transcriptional activator